MKLMLLALLSATLISCTRVEVQPSAPTPVPVVTNTKDVVSFRVLGNAIGAKVRFSNSVDGLNQITTSLPFQQSIESSKDNAFFYLEATANGYAASVSNPFLSVQIVVNGVLFREASTTSIFFDTITVSGTYHR
jgi:hypothetical protein